MKSEKEELGIKEYIKEEPGVIKILSDYKLSCVTCQKNCLVKNIPEMESFSLQKEIEFTEAVSKLDDDS